MNTFLKYLIELINVILLFRCFYNLLITFDECLKLNFFDLRTTLASPKQIRRIVETGVIALYFIITKKIMQI
jgi:hypothetical protein